MEHSWAGMQSFRLHGQNGRFVKFLLCRISGFVDEQCGLGSGFDDYFYASGKPYEIEHIWANHYSQHLDEFKEKEEFSQCRDSIGDLVLLPRGTNQSYSDKPYEEKQPHYVKENLLVKSLCPLTYENNPNFAQMREPLNLPFCPHEEFKNRSRASLRTLASCFGLQKPRNSCSKAPRNSAGYRNFSPTLTRRTTASS